MPTKQNLSYFIFFLQTVTNLGSLRPGGLRAMLSLGARGRQPLTRCGVSPPPPPQLLQGSPCPARGCLCPGGRAWGLPAPARPSTGHSSDPPPGGGPSGGERGCSDLSFTSPSQILPSARGRGGKPLFQLRFTL